ncbi:MAG: phosphoribosylamine--glycine ligase [Candidatus Bathyarchaeota archaeon]|nr:phosphoribosylamine--glycine ligase [Candidatus Bathyarchaeota archaeon]
MKVLVVGNGAREHAIAKKLHGDGAELTSAMAKRNPGIAAISKRVELIDINKPADYDRFTGVDIAFIGPEAPLAAGIADTLNAKGIPTVGPVKNLARLEWSKSYARLVLEENGIPCNPAFKICRNLFEVKTFLKDHPDVAVKPEGLTGGKGVKLTGEQLHSAKEVEDYCAECIRNDGLVVLEEKLRGKEFTLQAFVDGKHVEVMPLVRDFKRAYDGDKGPNTGSMGSFSCPDHGLPDLSTAAVKKGVEIMKTTISSLTEEVGEYHGFLYGGFMNTERGVYLIEYNSRLGDPEAINVLALLDDSLIETGFKMVDGKLRKPAFRKEATVCVYVVPEGYPDNPKKDQPITVGKLSHSEPYYASVYEEGGVIKTTGSRAVALLAKGKSVAEARERVYSDANAIKGALFYRRDIASGV